ncbi:hypothetical protein KIW84_UN0718 [Lathyrus oleraceus]|nr:hypothetical protein KIW84_UN0718 [Pisum sativum]
MLQYHFALNGVSLKLKKRLKLFKSIFPKLALHDELMNCHSQCGDLKEVAVEIQNNLKASRIRFINVLVDIWQVIVQKFSLSSDQSKTGKSTSISLLYNQLEVFVLTTILELTGEKSRSYSITIHYS